MNEDHHAGNWCTDSHGSSGTGSYGFIIWCEPLCSLSCCMFCMCYQWSKHDVWIMLEKQNFQGSLLESCDSLSVDWSFPQTPHLTSSSPTSPDYWRDEWGKAIPGLWWLVLHLCAPPSHLFSQGLCRWTVLGVKLFSCYLPYIKMTQHSFFMGKNHLILFHEEDRIEMADWTPSLSK